MTPTEQQRLAELRQLIAKGSPSWMLYDRPDSSPRELAQFLLRLLDEMTRDRNGWGDRCQELQSKLDEATAPPPASAMETASKLWYEELAVSEPRTVHGRITAIATALTAAERRGYDAAIEKLRSNANPNMRGAHIYNYGACAADWLGANRPKEGE